jgi:hypothetical protein
MAYNRLMLVLFCALGLTWLAACSNEQKEDLGLTRTPPDEFAVITRAPLSVPPDYTLRPPRPGVARPMETATRDQARQTIFGAEDSPSASQNTQTVSESFLDKVGVSEADPSIRERLEVENTQAVNDTRPVAQRFMFWKDGEVIPGDVIDPREEIEKIREEADGASE